MPPRPGFVRRANGLGTRSSTICFSEENYAWLAEVGRARMCTLSAAVNEAVECYRAAVDGELERAERAKAGRPALPEEDVEP